MRYFKNREHAGRELAELLQEYKKEDLFILALPRGGVPVAYEIAKQLKAPMDVLVVRKIGLPGNEEFGIGAIGEENVILLEENIIHEIDVSSLPLEKIVNEQKGELNRRVSLYRNGRRLPNLSSKTVIIVDDGLATGVSARAALKTVMKLKPKKIIYASPVCAKTSKKELSPNVDDVVCSITADNLEAIGYWYRNFEQINDEEVVDLLKKAELRTIGKIRSI